MTKEQLQQELKEKVKAGVKPSHLKKLKRSKSADDIPAAPASPTLKIKQLEDKISVLELKIETKDRDLLALETENKTLKKHPPNLLLSDQLKEKQKELESLRQKLENQNTPAELDSALFARHQNLKAWFSQYSKNQQLDAELEENIEQASTELINQDKQIVDLQSQVRKLELTNQSLTKDLNLVTRLAESRKYPLPTNSPNLDYLKYVFYVLVAISFISLLNTAWEKNYAR